MQVEGDREDVIEEDSFEEDNFVVDKGSMMMEVVDMQVDMDL